MPSEPRRDHGVAYFAGRARVERGLCLSSRGGPHARERDRPCPGREV